MGYAVKLQKKGSRALVSGTPLFIGDNFYYKYTKSSALYFDTVTNNFKGLRLNASSSYAMLEFTENIKIAESNMKLVLAGWCTNGSTASIGCSIDGGTWKYTPDSTGSIYTMAISNTLPIGTHTIRLGFKVNTGALKPYACWAVGIN
jgi:hypothetical protein